MVRKVLVSEPTDYVLYDRILNKTPILACKYGRIMGMIVYRSGWELMLPDGISETCQHETREKCIERGMALGYSFFIEE